MKYIVYHNSRCSKSRCALDYLSEKQIEFTVIEYLKETPSKRELKSLLKKLGMKAQDLIRKNEDEYKSLFEGKTLSENEWINAMIKYPKLIERPIVVKGDKAIIARPTEKIDDL